MNEELVNESELQKPLPSSQQQKLTDWENEPTIETLKKDLLNSKSSHDAQIAKMSKWSDLLNISGSAKPPKRPGRSSVQPKLVRKQAEWRYSALSEPFLGTENIFKVYPRTFEDETSAKQNSLLLNWQFNTKLNKVRFIDDYVRSVVDEGTCIVKLSWNRQTKIIQKEVPVFDYYPLQPTDEQSQQMIEILQQAVQLSEQNPREFNETVNEDVKAAVEFSKENGVPVYAQQVGTTIEEEEIPVINEPVVEILNPANVYIDPTCNGDFTKALFVIHAFETNRAELSLNTGRYQNLDKINWEDADPSSDGEYISNSTQSSENFSDKTRKKIIAYEYWGYYDIHKDGNLVPFVGTWIGNTLIRMEENPFPDEKIPFVLVQYLPVKREVYGEPDAELLEENQRILGAVTRGMIDSLGRSANAQQGFAKGMLDPVNRRRFENGEDYEFNPTMNPAGGGYIEHQYPELPQSAMLMVQMQNQEAESLTGVKAFSGGLAGDAYNSKVATAIRGVLDAAAKREMSILRRLAKGICQIGEKIVAMNGEFLSDIEVVRVTNRQYVEINREDLKGNFDLEVDIATAEVDNEKAQDLGFMLQTLGPNMGPEISLMILAEIADLKRMPSLAEKLRNYQPQPDPMAEQAKKLELQKLQMEVAKLQAEVQKIQADAGLQGAKAQSEMATAQYAGINAQMEAQRVQTEAQKAYSDMEKTAADADLSRAKADNERLTYALNANGTAHQQDMEKMRAQAQGNQNLEVTKALLKSRKPEETKPDVEAAVGFNSISEKLADRVNSI